VQALSQHRLSTQALLMHWAFVTHVVPVACLQSGSLLGVQPVGQRASLGPQTSQAVPAALHTVGAHEVGTEEQVPAWHRRSVLVDPVQVVVPQEKPSGRVVSMQTGDPVAHEVLPPVLQALPDEQALASAHTTHAPFLQTWPVVPHGVPLLSIIPLS
jgi:hypothetical protein